MTLTEVTITDQNSLRGNKSAEPIKFYAADGGGPTDRWTAGLAPGTQVHRLSETEREAEKSLSANPPVRPSVRPSVRVRPSLYPSVSLSPIRLPRLHPPFAFVGIGILPEMT